MCIVCGQARQYTFLIALRILFFFYQNVFIMNTILLTDVLVLRTNYPCQVWNRKLCSNCVKKLYAYTKLFHILYSMNSLKVSLRFELSVTFLISSTAQTRNETKTIDWIDKMKQRNNQLLQAPPIMHNHGNRLTMEMFVGHKFQPINELLLSTLDLPSTRIAVY